MDDFKIDARRWRFLNNPAGYIERGAGGLQVEPLTRQFKTARNILQRLADGRGVLLADHVGLGKTTVGALVAWVVVCQGRRVRNLRAKSDASPPLGRGARAPRADAEATGRHL